MNQPEDQHERRSWQAYAALAASLLLILVASLHYGHVEPAASSGGIDRELLGSLQLEHLQSKQAMLMQFAGNPPLYPAWETQMDQLEQAEQVIYNALRKEPANLELLRMLRLVQKKQLDLIDSVFAPRAASI